MERTKWLQAARGLAKQLLFLLFWILIWQFAAWRVNVPFILPAPLAVLKSFLGLLRSSVFYRAIGRSLVSLALGFGIGCLIGILTAIPSALSKTVTSFVSPLYTVIRATPVASFIIIAWVFLDKARLPAFISLLMTVPIVWSNLSRGIRALDRSLLEVTRVYRFSFIKSLRVYWLPSLFPFLSAGFSTALGLAWKSSIATEILVKSTDTIGYYIWDAKAWSIDTAALFAWTAAVIIISLLFDSLVGLIFGRLSTSKTRKKEALQYAEDRH